MYTLNRGVGTLLGVSTCTFNPRKSTHLRLCSSKHVCFSRHIYITGLTSTVILFFTFTIKLLGVSLLTKPGYCMFAANCYSGAEHHCGFRLGVSLLTKPPLGLVSFVVQTGVADQLHSYKCRRSKKHIHIVACWVCHYRSRHLLHE